MTRLPANEIRMVGADRVLAVLKELANHAAGVSLDELTRSMGQPKPTVHRALGALRRAGLADRDSYGHYVVGDELLRIAFAHHEQRPEHVRIAPTLEALASHFGETAHYAVLDGHEVVYRAKVDPLVGAVRLTSVIGGRNPAHATGVGKALLAHALPTRQAVVDWIGDRPLVRRTPATRCTIDALHEDLEAIRARGYSIDDHENEPGIGCVAVAVFLHSPTTPSGAVSVSALTYRTPLEQLVEAADEIRRQLGAFGIAA